MSFVVTISGSPSAGSLTQLLATEVGATIAARGFEVEAINVRDLPAEDLLHARAETPAVRAALALVERARGVVVFTPIYKAAYSGVLKTFLDLLPQFGLAGKVVLPMATGGSLAHVLALDYALRPVLQALGAQHVVAGLFILDRLIERRPEGGVHVNPEIATRLEGVVTDFLGNIRRLDVHGT